MAKWNLFGRRRSQRPQQKFTTYNRSQFLELCSRIPHHNMLKAIMGAVNARHLVLVMFESSPLRKGHELHVPEIIKDFPNAIEMYFQREIEQCLGRTSHYGSLLTRAGNGELRAELANKTQPETDYYRGTGTNLDKAYAWITHGWQGEAGLTAVRTALNHYLNHTMGTPALGRDDTMVADLNKRVVTDAPAFRPPSPQQNYPSSIGGRWLIKQIMMLTSGTTWPKAGDPKWIDYALFYYGALVSVQGFSDGNKRTSRMCYAVVMLKGGVPFVAPNGTMQKALANQSM